MCVMVGKVGAQRGRVQYVQISVEGRGGRKATDSLPVYFILEHCAAKLCNYRI